VLQWFDQSWTRALPAAIGVSLATTLTVAGAAVLGQARPGRRTPPARPHLPLRDSVLRGPRH